MPTTTTAGRGLAIAAGVAFTAGALYILLEDVVVKHHPWTMAHALTVLAVFGTIASGHLSGDSLRARHWLAALGFSLLFFVGTGLVVYNSVGRQAESASTGTLSAEDRNDQRAAAKKDLAEHQRMLDEELALHANEAARGGCGRRCKGIEASIAVYKAAVTGDQAKIAKLGPTEPVAPKAERMAEIAALFGANKAQAKAALILIEPFLYTLFFEFGSVVAWGYALRRQPQPKRQKPKPTALASVPDAELSELREAFKAEPEVRDGPKDGGTSVMVRPKRPKPSGSPNRPNRSGRSMTHSEIQADLMLRNATGRNFGSQQEAAKFYGYSESRFSELSKAWEAEGLIPKRRMVGKTKRLTEA